MSLSTPPNQYQPPLPQLVSPLTFKARIIREYRHWANLPGLRFVFLVLPICLLVFLSPLLPVVAYALWLWASSSWAWRDRWASIEALARRGGLFVGLVLVYAALSSAQVWIFPDLTATLQAFWRAHLPGELSLMPIFNPSLVARTLLLLPLAPALARYFERIDPRTGTQQRRILTARDLQPKPDIQQDKVPTPPEAAPQESKLRAKAKPTPKGLPPQPNGSLLRPPKQLTIDSSLASNQDQQSARRISLSRQATKKQKTVKAEAPDPAPISKQIDWNEVAE